MIMMRTDRNKIQERQDNYFALGKVEKYCDEHDWLYACITRKPHTQTLLISAHENILQCTLYVFYWKYRTSKRISPIYFVPSMDEHGR